MKKMSGLFLTAVFLLAQCSEDQRFLRDIDGAWNITTISFKSDIQIDSVWQSNGIILEFERCSRRDNKSLDQCNLVVHEGTNKTIYTYRVIDGALFFNLTRPHVPSRFDKVFIGPNFEVITLTNSDLFLRNQSWTSSKIEIRAAR